jgi:hypothetical protein
MMDGSNASAHYGAPLPTGNEGSTYAAMFAIACAKAMPMRAMFLEETREPSRKLGPFLCGCVVCVGT